VYRVLSEEAEEFNGYHCLGRSLQDTVLIRWSTTPVPPLRRQLATCEVHKASRQAMDGRGLIGHKTVLKHL
jgi:hypothetical protein